MKDAGDGSNHSLTRTVTSGGVWLTGASGFGMLVSLAAQVLLGWFLADDDFGVYAIAIGVSAFVAALKDAGVRLWLSQLGRREFDASASTAFWLSVFASASVAVVIALGAPAVSRIYNQEQLLPVLLFISLATLASPYAPVALASLQVAHRFRALSAIEVTTVLVRHSLVVLLAVAGFGPLSFVIPLVVANVVESVAAFVATRLHPWRQSSRVVDMKKLAAQTKWTMIGVETTTVLRSADYVALGVVATTATVGTYYFAYQLSFRLTALFVQGLRQVVLPVFASASGELKRQARACRQGVAFLSATATPALIGLALIAPELESILWRGRWEAAVPAIRIFAAVLPLEVIAMFAAMVSQAAGQFRPWAVMTGLRGLGLGAVALIAGWLGNGTDVTTIAGWIAGYMAVSAVVAGVVFFRGAGVPAGGLLRSELTVYAYSIGGSVLVALGLNQVDYFGLPNIGRLVLAGFFYAAVLALGWSVLFKDMRTDVGYVLRAVPGVGRIINAARVMGRTK